MHAARAASAAAPAAREHKPGGTGGVDAAVAAGGEHADRSRPTSTTHLLRQLLHIRPVEKYPDQPPCCLCSPASTAGRRQGGGTAAAGRQAMWSSWRAAGWAAVAAVGSCSASQRSAPNGLRSAVASVGTQPGCENGRSRCCPSAREARALFASPRRLLSREGAVQVKPKSHRLAGVQWGPATTPSGAPREAVSSSLPFCGLEEQRGCVIAQDRSN